MATAEVEVERVVGGTGGAAERMRLAEVPLGEEVELERMDVPDSDLEALLERGVLPGCRLCPVRRSPFGDPIVRVEGTVLALRREMAWSLCVRRVDAAA
ncbi:MAG: FeoA family protein [Gemmatimonadota bacterium]